MLDRLVVPPSVHVAVGITVVLAALIATALVVRLALQKRPLNAAAQVALAVTQLALLAQLLIGVKLLDQGMGVMQLYIHYIGGITPLGLFLAMRWLPAFEKHQTRITAVVSVITLISVVMTLTIGNAFVRGGMAS